MHRDLGHPVVVVGDRRARDGEDGRCDVDRVAELVADRATIRDPVRPVHDERVTYPAAVRVLLVPAQR